MLFFQCFITRTNNGMEINCPNGMLNIVYNFIITNSIPVIRLNLINTFVSQSPCPPTVFPSANGVSRQSLLNFRRAFPIRFWMCPIQSSYSVVHILYFIYNPLILLYIYYTSYTILLFCCTYTILHIQSSYSVVHILYFIYNPLILLYIYYICIIIYV